MPNSLGFDPKPSPARCLHTGQVPVVGKGGENLVGFGPGLTRGQISLES